jgi:heat shock protein HtpX
MPDPMVERASGGDPDARNRLKSEASQMTTTATALTTRLRTWLLVAGLTGLVVAVGALIGGSFLWLFAALAVIFNLVGYFYSDRIALRVARAQPLSEHDAPEIHALVRDLAWRAVVPMPRLYVMPGEQPNAFATGRDPKHSAVALTEALVDTMEPEHVHAVVAHELGHVRNRDVLVSSVAAMLAGAIAAAVNVLQLSFMFGGEDDENPLGLLGTIAALILAPIVGTLLQLGISRQREYLADATAARLLGSGEPLADALAVIDRSRDALAVNPATAPMYIVNPLAAGSMAQLFSTHPPLKERIRRLRAYGERSSHERTADLAALSRA